MGVAGLTQVSRQGDVAFADVLALLAQSYDLPISLPDSVEMSSLCFSPKQIWKVRRMWQISYEKPS